MGPTYSLSVVGSTCYSLSVVGPNCYSLSIVGPTCYSLFLPTYREARDGSN